jgi:hypothetical protein
MARFKDFGLGKADDASSEPLSFKIHGEDFQCRARLQGKTLLEFIELANSENAGDSAKVTRTFFERVMLQESYIRFNALLDDAEKIVTVDTLSEIIGWLIEEYSNRPNPQPEA